jgi:DNA-binding NtrC family response regulator
MKADTTLAIIEQTEERTPSNVPAVPFQAERKPGNGPGARPAQQDPIAALALSLDSLYGCIELINEGRPAPIQEIMDGLERSIISQAMIRSRANIRGAAVLLGIKYTTLYAKLRKHGLQFSKAMRFCQDPSPAEMRWLGR